MAKTRKQKEKLVKEYADKIEKAKSAVILDYKGLKVKDSEELRGKLLENGSEFVVTKNSLLKLAFKKRGISIPEEYYTKPLAITFSYQDEILGLKEFDIFAKNHQELEVIGGFMGEEYLEADRVNALASLPSKDELYAKVVGTIAAPLSGMVNVLSGNIRGLVNVLNQYKEQKS